MKPFDPTKPVRTQSGLPVRIICTDRKAITHPILALVLFPSGKEDPITYTNQGKLYMGKDHEVDLVNIPVKRWRWAINHFDGTRATNCYFSEEEAMRIYTKAKILGRISETEIEE